MAGLLRKLRPEVTYRVCTGFPFHVVFVDCGTKMAAIVPEFLSALRLKPKPQSTSNGEEVTRGTPNGKIVKVNSINFCNSCANHTCFVPSSWIKMNGHLHLTFQCRFPFEINSKAGRSKLPVAHGREGLRFFR